MGASTSIASAERFLQLYRGRTGKEPGLDRIGRRRQSVPRPRDVKFFREIVLEHIGHIPKLASEILADVADDYGTFEGRRFWRALKYWRNKKRIERVEGGYRRVSRRRGGGRT